MVSITGAVGRRFKMTHYDFIKNATIEEIAEVLYAYYQIGTIDKCREMKKEIEKNKWILCSERLPEVPEDTDDKDCPEFNVMIKGASIATTLKYSPDGAWFDDLGQVYEVIVWMPLPEPWEGENDV